MASSLRWLDKKPVTQQPRLLPAQKRAFTLKRGIITAITLLCIAVYTLLNGAGPAAIRSGIMGSLLVLAPRLGRIYNVYTALAFTALVMSAIDPFVLWDVGFQLSMLGTLGIVMLTPLFQRLLHPFERIPGSAFLLEIIAVTLAAQVATLPITALAFQQLSFIAPLANILTVPLLGTFIMLGLLICGTGLAFAPLGAICGWIAWPLLWYVIAVITWCARLPYAYLPISQINGNIAWGYYGLLGLAVIAILYRWPAYGLNAVSHHAPLPLIPRRTLRIVQGSFALLVIVAIAVMALSTQPSGHTTVSFLHVGYAGKDIEGEAILVSTPDGKTILIDGGPDATTLSQELDTRLPFWQRSIDVVILTTPQTDHLTGLEDVINRYQVGEVIDAGMLHPNTGYALWRKSIQERSFHYTQARQGTTIQIGAQAVLQVLWPEDSLHKGSNEEEDNALVMRLDTPEIHMIFLGIAALSPYALQHLSTDIPTEYLSAPIVQIVGNTGKSFPPALSSLLQQIHPSLLVITPGTLNPAQRKSATPPTVNVSASIETQVGQIIQTGEVDTFSIQNMNQQLQLTP